MIDGSIENLSDAKKTTTTMAVFQTERSTENIAVIIIYWSTTAIIEQSS